MTDEARANRAAARRSQMPGTVGRLGDFDRDAPLTKTTTPSERLGMMWALALDSWTSLGRPLPRYSRDSMPGRVLRPDD